MSSGMNSVLVPGAAGDIYLYQDGKISGAVPRFIVSLTMGIKGELLKRAAEELIVRFPQFAAGISAEGESLVLSPKSGGGIPVEESVSGHNVSEIHIGGPETGGYLFRITYCGKTVFFDWHLSLCDERGMAEFVKSVIFRYIQICGYDIENDGSVKEPDVLSSVAEGLDPYVRLEDIPASRPVWYMDAKAFAVPSLLPEEEKVFQIRIPLSKVKGQVRQYIAQPEAFISPMFSHVLYEKYSSEIEEGEYIVSMIRENLRPHFPTASLRSFFTPLTLAYNRNVTEYPIGTILMSQKKLLDAQLRSDALAYSARRFVKLADNVRDERLSFAEKVAKLSESMRKLSETATFSICNMGNTVMPETLQQYITEFYPVFPTAYFAYTMSIVNFKGEMVVTVVSKDGDRSVPASFVRLLNSQDIYAFISDEFSFSQLGYVPKMK